MKNKSQFNKAMEKYPENLGSEAYAYIPEVSEDTIKKEAERITEKDVKYVEENFWKKISQLKGKLGFKRDLIALYKFMKDPKISFLKKTIVVLALLYFIIPFDSIPDFAPIAGFLDDIGIVAMVVRYLSKELEPYYD